MKITKYGTITIEWRGEELMFVHANGFEFDYNGGQGPDMQQLVMQAIGCALKYYTVNFNQS